jgi:hypothetical protein
MRATPRGLDAVSGDVEMALDQVAPWIGTAGEREVGAFAIDRTHRPATPVPQELGPALFGVPDDNRMGMERRLLGQKGGMRTAEDHGGAARAVVVGPGIAAHARAGDRGDPDDVGVQVRRNGLDGLVVNLDLGFVLGWNEAGECREREGSVVKGPREHSVVAVHRAGGSDQGDLHRRPPTGVDPG